MTQVNGVHAKKMRYKFFRDLSNGNTIDMDVDGSGTEKHYDLVCSLTERWKLNRVNIHILDPLITNVKFAGISALTNGCLFRVYDKNNVLLLDFLDGEAIKQNSEFAWLAGRDVSTAYATGDDLLPIRWTVGKAGKPMIMNPGDYMRFTIRDNVSAVNAFSMQGQAVWIEDYLG